ncbi:unnamed protein product [Penicillium salamii]|nr:unnamed protein product [Penicillium salamii]CAG8205384.1 unnamed protein product [Penicillium salamii]CAG8428683.1 unnamed protein product [Penicillium salamii]
MPLAQSIQALPSDVIAKLKSSTSVIDLAGVIVELVKNALDGNAHTVFVTVDFRRGGCIVEDDGDGIAPNEFETTGGLGKPHHTSKFEHKDSYGHRGLFLASLAALSLLTLTSHHAAHEATNSMIFHHSQPIARLIPAPPHHALRSASHGTAVTVNDLFGNMPVRVKNRAISLRKAGEIDREWDNLRNILVSLVLANSQVSRLVLLDTEKSKRISIRPSTSSPPANPTIGGDAFDFRRIGSILNQCGLIGPHAWKYWHELSASVPDLTVRAAVSLQASPSRKMQFISLGKEPLVSRNGSNIVYNEINRLFSLSDFGSFDILPSDASSRHINHPVDTNKAQSNESVRSWTKPINKWPMFYIRIDTSDALRLSGNDDSGHLPESDKSIQRILDVLGVMIREFLKQHDMRPRSGKQQTLSSDRSRSIRSKGSCSIQSLGVNPKQGRPASSADEALSGHFKIPSFARLQAIDHGQDFTNWSRVKAAKPPEAQSVIHRHRRSVTSPGNQIQGEVSLPTRTQSGPGVLNHHPEPRSAPVPSNTSNLDGTETKTANLSGDTGSALSPGEMITWIDPHTKLAYLINPRTGQTMNSRKSLATRSSHLNTPDDTAQESAHGLWIQSLLESWSNPSFSRMEAPILNLGTETVPQHDLAPSHDCFKGIGSLDTAQVAKYRGKLQRRGLEAAEVIAQVDKKFILAKVPTTAMKVCENGTSESVLLLIDQHAADERCRIEQLFEEMFLPPDETITPEGRVRTVQVFLEFQVSGTEGRLFNRYTAKFASWGVHYDTEAKNSYTLVTFHTLPVLIAERCRTEPQVLVDLMRREIWSSEEVGGSSFQAKPSLGSESEDRTFESLDIDSADRQPTNTSASHSWVQKMNGCPQGIVDLLNSRACRTAIMFNDSLDIGECRALLSRLARCAFPFQCAHGRPSMVPILDLRSVPDTHVSLPLDLEGLESADDHELDYMEAFRASYIA